MFAALPEPPYYAVIFSSLRNGEDDAGYIAASDRMVELAAQQPGYLGVETVRGADGFGITVSYWASEAAIASRQPRLSSGSESVSVLPSTKSWMSVMPSSSMCR